MDYSVLIPVYNGQDTIARAVESVEESAREIIIIDDGSTDDTAHVIREIKDPRLRLISLVTNQGVGHARQVAVEAASSEVILWLDADDMLLPGRAKALWSVLDRGADYAFGGAELYDGNSREKLRDLPIAERLFEVDGLWWQFGRNFIPSLGFHMARREAVLCVGYDTKVRHAEDYQHFLNALAADKKISVCRNKDYRQFHYPSSLSRHHQAHKKSVKTILSSFDNDWLWQKLVQSRCADVTKIEIMSMFLIQKEDWSDLNQFLQGKMVQSYKGSSIVLFFKGVGAYKKGDMDQAKSCFICLSEKEDRPDIWNNLGVILTQLDGSDGGCFQKALALKNDYQDALRNLNGGHHITMMPLRTDAYRADINAVSWD